MSPRAKQKAESFTPQTIRRPKKVEEILADLEAPASALSSSPAASTSAEDLADLDYREELKEEAMTAKSPTSQANGPSSSIPSFLSNGAPPRAEADFEDEDDEEEDDEEDDEVDDDFDDEVDDDFDDDVDDDDDDDDDQDDDEVDSEQNGPATPKKRGRPPKKAAPKKAAPRAMSMRPSPSTSTPPATPFGFSPATRLPSHIQREKIEQNLTEYDEMLSSIDFDVSKNHKILLSRVKPEWDMATGIKLTGYLEEFRRPVSVEEIRAKYGGGEYQLVLQGPSGHDGSGKLIFKKQKTIEIAGDPIINKNPRSSSVVGVSPSSNKASEDAQLQLVKQVMESKDRDAQRLWQEQQDLKKMLMQTMSKSDNGIKDVVTSALNGGGDLRREIMEERRLQEERMRAEREERQRELDRLAAERKRELELAQAQHERQLEMMRLQSEKQIEMMRLEQQRMVEELRARTTAEASSGRDLLLFMQKMESEKAATVQRQQELFLMQQQKQQELTTQQATKQQEFLLQQQMQAQQMLMAQMQNMQQTKESFLMEMLKEQRSKKDDFFQTMEKMQQFKSLMASMNGEEDSRERWEKVLDRVGEAAPGIVAVASSFLQSRGAQAAQAQGPQAEQRVLPGSVAVAEVELPAPPVRRQLPPKPAPPKASKPPKAKASPPKTPPATPAPPAPPSPSVTSTVLEATKPAAEGANPLTDFVFPPSDGSMTIPDAIPLLVQNIDLAIQREYPAQRIYEEVVAKFPIEVLTVLKLASADQMIEILEQRAPASWIVNSLVGVKKIEELHALLVA